MNNSSNTSLPHPTSSLRKVAMIALGCVSSFGLIQNSFATGVDATALRPLADKAPSLPLTTTFEKVAPGENGGPYVLNLKNNSKEALKVTVSVIQSVKSHSSPKTKNLPAQVIEAGKVWTIKDLAAHDVVSVSADGFGPLELTVP